MAHKKAGGSSRNGRDTAGRRLGVKIFGGQKAISGNIIIRQRGTTYHPGTGVGLGRDYTIFAVIDGQVKYSNIATLRNTKSGRSDAAIYPNPTKGELFLSCNNSVEEKVTAKVMDIFGRPVKEFIIELGAGENVVSLPNLSTLSQGTYLVRIPTSDGVITQRVILRQ